jgi:hypothetical protein
LSFFNMWSSSFLSFLDVRSSSSFSLSIKFLSLLFSLFAHRSSVSLQIFVSNLSLFLTFSDVRSGFNFSSPKHKVKSAPYVAEGKKKA